MKCLKCGSEMKVVRQDVSSNPDNEKQYDRVVYVCEADDIWVTTEIPK